MMPTNRLKPEYRRPPPRHLRDSSLQRPVLPPPNQLSTRPMLPSCSTSLTLPIPSPHLYQDNFHHPAYPFILAPLNRIATPELYPYRFPQPLGPLPAHAYNLLGVRLHDKSYVDHHPGKMFTKWLLWYLEISDFLLRMICPSDLNNVPCEWDELQGGCRMLRLCSQKAEWPHPHLGYLPLKCDPDAPAGQRSSFSVSSNSGGHGEEKHSFPDCRNNCLHLHDIEPTCRGVTKELYRPLEPEQEEDTSEIRSETSDRIFVRPDPAFNHHLERQFCSHQQCPQIAAGEMCRWGHDLESARIEAVFRYFDHLAEARQHGSIGVIKRDRSGRKAWKVVRPVLRALDGQQTFHGCRVEIVGPRKLDSSYAKSVDKECR